VNDRVIVITGAGRGIGAATALLAGRRGYSVCVNYRNNREAAETVVRTIESHGASAVAVAADVTVEQDVMRLFETCDRTLGRLTALVNNAGILETHSRVDAIDSARVTRIFATNVIGPFVCAREAVRRMSTRHGGQGGAIVNVDYAASKGAIDTMTIGLAQEVAQEGIRVNAVRPGVIYTDMHASGGEPDRVDRVKAFVPMRRGGHAGEVAHAILWLLSDEASYTTGTFIDVSGGR
jgi:NAD(P)-dependent dehydrogenase (short-subunit alcohol dehydrogenase family)